MWPYQLQWYDRVTAFTVVQQKTSMMPDTDTDNLLDRVQRGDSRATDQLFGKYRERLRCLVSIRLDQRVAARVDASDVIQDTFAKAAKRIEEYAEDRPIAFYPWLRKLAIDRIVELHREHIRAQRRSVTRERIDERGSPELSECGRKALLQQLVSMGDSPSQQTIRREETERAQSAVDRLPVMDREVLVLRYLEQLNSKEAAAVLGISENTYAQRHLRAIRRVRTELESRTSR